MHSRLPGCFWRPQALRGARMALLRRLVSKASCVAEKERGVGSLVPGVTVGLAEPRGKARVGFRAPPAFLPRNCGDSLGPA